LIKELSWPVVLNMIDRLCEQIQRSKIKFDGTISIVRGGNIPATIISHKLKIPYLETKDMVKSGSTILVVDDFCDSGATLKNFDDSCKSYKNHNDIDYKYAVIFKRRGSIFDPHFFFKEVTDNSWLHLPWETLESSVETPKSWLTGT